MNSGKYVFSQLVEFLPKRTFDGIVKKYQGDRYVMTFTCWNQLLVMMYGQLSGCGSLREVICIIEAIKNKSYHLGFGSGDIKLSNIAYANANRDYRIFEEFAYHMIRLALGRYAAEIKSPRRHSHRTCQVTETPTGPISSHNGPIVQYQCRENWVWFPAILPS